MSRPLAIWTPLPPQATGIADYSYELLGALSKITPVIAIVDDNAVNSCRAPSGVDVMTASQYRPHMFKGNLFQLGNNFAYHGYMLAPLLRMNAAIVMHDLSLYDFFWSMCSGSSRDILKEEIAYDSYGRLSQQEMEDIINYDSNLDRLRSPLLRRFVERESLIFVHSSWAKEFLYSRYGIHARVVPELTAIPEYWESPGSTERRPITFGVFGSLSHHKRIIVALKAFLEARRKHANMRLVIAGRPDDPSVLAEIKSVLDQLPSSERDGIEVLIAPSARHLETTMAACDVMVCLRWPTAGETSRIIMQSAALGKAVITSDVGQNRELPDDWCWRVAPCTSNEKEMLSTLMVDFARGRISAKAAGSMARRYAENNLSPNKVANFILSELDRWGELDVQGYDTTHTYRGQPECHLGFNAVGSWSTSTGIAEAARRSVLAAINAGMAVALEYQDVGAPTDETNVPPPLRSLPRGRPFPIDICYLNINEAHLLGDHYLPERRRGPLLASWAWELPTLPPILRDVASRLRPDAILALSTFVRDVLVRYVDCAVYVVPPIVNVKVDPQIGRQAFSLPNDATIYLMCFDANSGFRRKNPLGVIEAFRRAFPKRDSGAVLLIKADNLDRYPEAQVVLRRELDSVGGRLITEHLNMHKMGSLLATCDVYVSLHRSEGFGLGMAEAMMLGKPVVATAYSGSNDFVNHTTGFPVSYRLVPVRAGDFFLNPGLEIVKLHAADSHEAVWAEPDLDDAARQLSRLNDNPVLRKQRGEVARSFINQHYGPGAHAEVLRKVLEQY